MLDISLQGIKNAWPATRPGLVAGGDCYQYPHSLQTLWPFPFQSRFMYQNSNFCRSGITAMNKILVIAGYAT